MQKQHRFTLLCFTPGCDRLIQDIEYCKLRGPLGDEAVVYLEFRREGKDPLSVLSAAIKELESHGFRVVKLAG
jgi:hypothetical protein